MKWPVLSISILLLLIISQFALAQSKSKTIIIKQYQQDNGEWKTDTIGKIDLSKMMNLNFEIDRHIDQSLARIDSLIPDISLMESMLGAFNKHMMTLDTSLNNMSKRIASNMPNLTEMQVKFDSIINSKLANTQIKIVTGNNLKKVMMINGNKIEIKQNTEEENIIITYFTDQDGEFLLKLLNQEEEILYEKKEEIRAGKYEHKFSTKDFKSGHYLIQIQHNHLFLLEQLQIMHN